MAWRCDGELAPGIARGKYPSNATQAARACGAGRCRGLSSDCGVVGAPSLSGNCERGDMRCPSTINRCWRADIGGEKVEGSIRRIGGLLLNRQQARPRRHRKKEDSRPHRPIVWGLAGERMGLRWRRPAKEPLKADSRLSSLCQPICLIR
jgi:hypothetical protein